METIRLLQVRNPILACFKNYSRRICAACCPRSSRWRCGARCWSRAWKI